MDATRSGASALLAALVLAAGAAAQCELFELLPGSPAPNAGFGWDVALDGDTAVVASRPSATLPLGDVRVYERGPTGWTEVDVLASPAVQAGDEFGYSVALNGDTALVGAPSASGVEAGSGAVHVFERGPSGWTPAGTIVADTEVPGEGLGWRIDLESDRAAVSAGKGFVAGAVYVFDRDPSGWIQNDRLQTQFPSPLDQFGAALGFDGDRVLVGDPSPFTTAAYVFDETASGWTRTPIAPPNGANTLFGFGVDLDGDRAVVGAPLDAKLLGGDGAAYVFDFSGTSWVQTGKLAGPNGVGGRVAVSGARILAAAQFGATANRVQIHELGPAGWVETGQLVTPQPDGSFNGSPLVEDAGRVLVAADGFDGGALDAGAVFEFSVRDLCAEVESLSLSSGGVQHLALSAGPAHALGLHLLLGSATGTVPGQSADGLTIPLNLDAYYLFVLLNPNGPLHPSSLGFLDAVGKSAAPAVDLPPGTSPSLAGVTLNHAFVLLDLVPSPSLAFASNAWPLTLVP